MGSRLAIALCLCLAAPAWAAAPQAPAADQAATFVPAPLSMSAAALPDKVRLGEAFTLTIEVRDSSEVRYELPAGFSLGKDFDVVKLVPTRIVKDAETTTRFEVQVLLFDLGDKTMGDIVLKASGPRGTGVLSIPGPKIVGVGELKDDDKAELHDILPPVEVLVPRYTALWVIGISVVTTLLALLFLRWLAQRPRRVKIVTAPPRAPAWERAMAALDTLQREDLPGKSRPKEFFFRLSEILRDYLGERFGFLAPDMTTEELLASLTRLSTPGLDFRRFEAWCHEGDLVKFARAPVTAATCKQAIEDAFGFVLATRPPPGPGQKAVAP
jgi:hypothetical protein